MSPRDDVFNSDIFLWALHELGGDREFVDVETVFIRCFELAPRRFAWRTRLDLPDYKKCAKALRDSESRRPPLLVKTGDSFGRQLSVAGQEWVAQNTERLQGALGSGRVVREPRQRPSSRMIAEAERNSTYEQWCSKGTVPHEKWRVAELLHCSPDSDTAVWHNRLEALRAAAHAADRRELEGFLESLSATHPDWFEGGVSR